MNVERQRIIDILANHHNKYKMQEDSHRYKAGFTLSDSDIGDHSQSHRKADEANARRQVVLSIAKDLGGPDLRYEVINKSKKLYE